MTRILVVDDDPAVTSVLRRGLSYEGFEVETAASGEEGLANSAIRRPDAVLLNLKVAGINSLEVLQQLRAADPVLPILLLTPKDTPAAEVAGLDSGADDYVTKPFSFEVLLARINALMRRQKRKSLPVLSFADLTLDTGTYEVKRAKRRVNLTFHEFKLLEEFLSHPRQILTKEYLLGSVWGHEAGGNVNIVEVYVMQLRQKIENRGESRLIHTVRGAGYVLRQE